MKKPRKQYKPKPINANAFVDAINLIKPVSESGKTNLNIAIIEALEAFVKGLAQKSHFDTLASTVDVSLIISRNIFDSAYMQDIFAARDGMIRCRERFAKTGKLGLDGEALNAIRFVIELHNEQLNHVTGAEVMKFMKKRDDHIRSGNYYKGEADRVAA